MENSINNLKHIRVSELIDKNFTNKSKEFLKMYFGIEEYKDNRLKLTEAANKSGVTLAQAHDIINTYHSKILNELNN